MTDTIPDHVGREACRLLNEDRDVQAFRWPSDKDHGTVITVAKLLMNPPAPMTDPDEKAAKRVMEIVYPLTGGCSDEILTRVTEQMRKEREAWEAGR